MVKVTTATFTLLWKAYRLQWGLSVAGPLELGSDSVYSEHNGAKQNGKEPHIVSGPCGHLQPCLLLSTLVPNFSFVTPVLHLIPQCTCLPVGVHFTEA